MGAFAKMTPRRMKRSQWMRDRKPRTALTFVELPRAPHSTSIRIDVSRGTIPFGAIWTFKIPGERHPWHAQPLRGEHKCFAKIDDAKLYMEQAAQ